jgi:starch synthase (maltosyl-transferring)
MARRSSASRRKEEKEEIAGADESAVAVAQHPAWSPQSRVVVESIYPEIDGGRYPVKRVVGDLFEVWADIFRDGHDVLGAALLYRTADEPQWQRAAMTHRDNDRWSGTFRLARNSRYFYTIEAWTDVFASWRRDVSKKVEAGQKVELELAEGRQILAAAARAGGAGARAIRAALERVTAAASPKEQAATLLDEGLHRVMAEHGPREDVSTHFQTFELIVDRPRAACAAWYEMFQRSQGTDPTRSATFDDCIKRLPAIHDLGFDVVYLVPVHPIGRVNRKGRNNTLQAGPEDPGSPYAIGSREGGHDAIHSDLGTLADFARFVKSCRELGMEVALDFAIQCAPDHPWVTEHPEWFSFRPDGTIKYAENPPKKYEDIVNVNFYGPHREALWRALRDVVLLWVERGVKIFRVDNPHTKPIPFWEWLIREVQTRHPDVIFLSEAFTRPKMMKALAKAGFTQSYTYFTWRNFKQEIVDYLTELTQSLCREYFRPNFFPNTPDILPPILQKGGPPAFKIRLTLAATLSSVYGIYNGFELCEGTAIPGKEEYASSEKYEYKVWDWDRPGNIKPFVAAINRIRRENPALQEFLNLTFWRADNDNVLFYSKMTADRRNMVFVAVNLDPFEPHDVTLWFPIGEIGLGDADAFEAEELLTGTNHLWRGSPQHIRLDPQDSPVAIFRLAVWKHVDYRTPNP